MLGAAAALERATTRAIEAPHRAKLVEKATTGLQVKCTWPRQRSGLRPGYDGPGRRAVRRASARSTAPEARWRRQPSDVADLAGLQAS